jgi:hypothetical protein
MCERTVAKKLEGVAPDGKIRKRWPGWYLRTALPVLKPDAARAMAELNLRKHGFLDG